MLRNSGPYGIPWRVLKLVCIEGDVRVHEGVDTTRFSRYLRFEEDSYLEIFPA